ncbi:DUF2336 domain-containing protein [Brevundimonas kwangchunensis]|uniref:DUF2336 domain-containing protein n=1 Tax=Brevundimonas kwangchunensis TaxID=322163 RepID=A0ABN1GWT1_9CAUL
MTVLVQLVQPDRDPNVAPSATELLALARNAAPDARQRLLLGVIALCDAAPPSGELSPVLGEIFLTLARQAEREVRKALAERLADADWAPSALINVLALDEFEIARPILLSSPVLRDDDLLQVLIKASLEHQIAVARRPNISGRVADAVLDRGDPIVVTALATNRTAEISAEGMRRMVDLSRRIAALRSPLSRHPGLTTAMAEEMYQWVGEALRQAISTRFEVDETKLTAAVYDAVQGVMRPARPGELPDAEGSERDEMERRLAAKLHAAKQLKPGVLVRAAREKRLGLVIHGLATLGDFNVAQIRKALAMPSPEAFYYACAAVGIDRAAFPTLLADVRKLNRALPGDRGDSVWQRGAISPASATRAFRALIEAEAPQNRLAV